MGQYTIKGLYNKYDKNNKKRDALDYYATPTIEVVNILKNLNIDFNNSVILEPCVGGGHMANGIDIYIKNKDFQNVKTIGTDIKNRNYQNENWLLKYNLDFFADDYPYESADWIIMNPPYSVIEPFVIRAYEIAQKGMIMLGRLQFLEGEDRFEHFLSSYPPTDVYVYVDRIQCWKNGVEPEGSSAQAYAWFIWDKRIEKKTELHWLRRANKGGLS